MIEEYCIYTFLVWLQGAFYLAKLYSCLLYNPQYVMDMIKFIDNIICCLILNILMAEKTSQKAPSASLNKTDEEFALKFYKDSNAVSSRTQVHFFLHNVTCFKYGIAMTGKC